MRTLAITRADLCGVIAVPPLARVREAGRAIDFDQNSRLVTHIIGGGCKGLLYGGNAFLYHLTLAEYAALLEWMASRSDDIWMIPSAGPSYGRMMDQAPMLRPYGFPCVMALPCADPRDPAGLEVGLREFAELAGTRLMLYVKDETNFGPDREAGLDAIGRMVADRTCIAIKYAVVRPDPSDDPYLDALLRRVPTDIVISGMGERPAPTHMLERQLPGFTTGSGCVAPALSTQLFRACAQKDEDEAWKIRELFLALEDLRDAWGPARTVHAAVEAAGIASMGPTVPFVSELTREQIAQLTPVARELRSVGAACIQASAGQ